VRHGWDGHVMVIAGAEGATPAERAIPYPLLQPWMKLSAMLRCRINHLPLSTRALPARTVSLGKHMCQALATISHSPLLESSSAERPSFS